MNVNNANAGQVSRSILTKFTRIDDTNLYDEASYAIYPLAGSLRFEKFYQFYKADTLARIKVLYIHWAETYNTPTLCILRIL